MFGVLTSLLGVLRATLRSRRDLVLENLLLRHQLAALTRPTRKRPRRRRRDKLLWVLARRLCPDWRRRLVQATPWGRTPRFLIRDRDRVHGPAFAARAARLGIGTVLTPVRAPRANAVAERLVGTLRRECFDHLIVLNERHVRTVLAEFVAYYNAARPHRTLDLETERLRHGPIRAIPVLGGLHHTYERAA